MKVLVVGSGGREHAIAWACSRSRLNPVITCAPGNGGTARIARNVDIKAEDADEIVDFARDQRFDLVVVGPEAPLVAGLADKLAGYGFPVFGPGSQAARIEGSKAFAKELMADVGLPTARFAKFTDYAEAKDYIARQGAPIVIKASGLASGKGVMVCRSVEDACAAAEAMLLRDAFGASGREIVVEEYLTGRELSLLTLADGERFIILPSSRDYKRAYDNDRGPNTGGMGAYAPVEELSRDELVSVAKRVVKPVLKRLAELGTPYRGCLYGGLMITSESVRVLEFNCRFGDPESQTVFPLLKLDLLELMAEVADGGLKGWLDRRRLDPSDLDWISLPQHAVTVVAAAEGYPDRYNKGMEITSLPDEDERVIPFHAGTVFRNGRYCTSGGRVMAVTGVGGTHQEALETAYAAVDRVRFKGVRFRRDIGVIANN